MRRKCDFKKKAKIKICIELTQKYDPRKSQASKTRFEKSQPESIQSGEEGVSRGTKRGACISYLIRFDLI